VQSLSKNATTVEVYGDAVLNMLVIEPVLIYFFVFSCFFVYIVAVRVNANIKTETLDELEQKKKNMHKKAFQVLIDDAQRVFQEPKQHRGSFVALMQELQTTRDRHCALDVAVFRNNKTYCDLVTEMLNVHLWTIEQLKLDSGHPSTLSSVKEACRNGIESKLRRQDHNFLQEVFNARCNPGSDKMDIEAFKMALSDVQAPICNTSLLRFGDDGCNFRTFVDAVENASDEIEQYLENYKLSIMADSLRHHLKSDNQLSQFSHLQNGILRVAAQETADRLLVRLMEPHLLLQHLMCNGFDSRRNSSAAEKFSVNTMATGTERDFIFTRLESRIGKCPPIAQLFRLLTAAFGRCSQSGF
jgi:hypothetical protein